MLITPKIDYLLLSQSIAENVIDCKIHNIIISDHAPISVLLSLSVNNHKNKQWRFNNSLLKDEVFVSLIRERITEYINDNLRSVPSIQTVWEAFKVTCRGWIISYSTAKKKRMMMKKNSLISDLKTLEAQHMLDPNNLKLKNEMLTLKADLQSIIHEETAFALFRLRRKYFEAGDKAGKMLSLRLKQLENRQSIPFICDSTGTPIYEQTQINNAFREFYFKLYQTESSKNEKDMEAFFKDVHLPTLKEEEREHLEVPVCESEIISALKALSLGKAPGNDGYTIEFYKCFQRDLSPLLTLLFNDIITNQSMPLTMRQATISLLPKPGKDHSQMSNFRPLSLLNNDYKLFAKILAMRMETVVSSLIYLDQVGFIKGRLVSNNMRRLLHVMAKAGTLQHPAIAISLDAEKAFDRIEWHYLFYVLSKFGFGPLIINWVMALYNKPTTSIKTNGIISEPFHLRLLDRAIQPHHLWLAPYELRRTLMVLTLGDVILKLTCSQMMFY